MAYIPHVVMIIAPDNFRDEELFKTKEVLEGAGIIVSVACAINSEVTGMLGGKVTPDLLIGEITCRDNHALIFVGGSGAARYFNYDPALQLARLAVKHDCLVAAICIAPSILANAGILKGKKATAFITEKENLISKGARYENKSVVVDGKIITAQSPEYSEDFGKAIIKALFNE